MKAPFSTAHLFHSVCKLNLGLDKNSDNPI